MLNSLASESCSICNSRKPARPPKPPPRPISPPSPPPGPSATQWECSGCHLYNDNAVFACALCASANPSSPTQWAYERCTLMNGSAAELCAVCSGPRKKKTSALCFVCFSAPPLPPFPPLPPLFTSAQTMHPTACRRQRRAHMRRARHNCQSWMCREDWRAAGARARAHASPPWHPSPRA